MTGLVTNNQVHHAEAWGITANTVSMVKFGMQSYVIFKKYF